MQPTSPWFMTFYYSTSFIVNQCWNMFVSAGKHSVYAVLTLVLVCCLYDVADVTSGLVTSALYKDDVCICLLQRPTV